MKYRTHSIVCNDPKDSFEHGAIICEQYQQYKEAFSEIQNQLPKAFVKEFLKEGFHDNQIGKIELLKVRKNGNMIYNVTIWLEDASDYEIKHVLTFENTTKASLDIQQEYSDDLLVCEILAVNEHTLSFEALLSSDSTVYLEFSKLRYQTQRA